MKACEALAEAMGLLRSDVPAAYFRIVDELDGLAVAIDVQGERFVAAAAGSELRLDADAATPSAWLCTDRATVLMLVDGALTQLDAVLDRRLDLRADAALLDRLARAGRAFGDGALRAPRCRALLDRLRASWG